MTIFLASTLVLFPCSFSRSRFLHILVEECNMFMFLFVCNHVLILKYAPIKLTMECETRCRTDRVPVKQNGCVTMLVTIHVFTYLFKLFGSKLNIYICLCRILMLFHKLGFSLSLSRPFVVCVCVCALEVCYLNIHCCCWLFALLHSF